MNHNSKVYFDDITKKIDSLEHPEVVISDSYGEVDGNNEVLYIPNNSGIIQEVEEVSSNLPSIDPTKIDGVLDLYNELNKKYGLSFNPERISNISDTFKAIIKPENKEIFEIYTREYLDRLRLVCINQLGNTVYSLISKLTSEETIRSLTISERVALLDRLFDYMDRVNNMVSFIPKGDTHTELQEISQRIDSDEGSQTKSSNRNREVEKFVLSLLSNDSKSM